MVRHLLLDRCNLLTSTIFCDTLYSTLKLTLRTCLLTEAYLITNSCQVQAFQHNLGTTSESSPCTSKSHGGIRWSSTHGIAFDWREGTSFFATSQSLSTFFWTWPVISWLQAAIFLDWTAFVCQIFSVTSSGWHESSEPLDFGLECLFIHLCFSLRASQTYMLPNKLYDPFFSAVVSAWFWYFASLGSFLKSSS